MQLTYLDKCQTGDLIRFRDETDTTRWAIVGKRSNDFHPIAVLSGEGAPFIVSAMINGHTIDVFDTYPVLNYGKEFELHPTHAGEAQIGDAPLLRTKGSLVFADQEKYLVSGVHLQSGVRYFDLKSGDVRGQPGGMIASFKTWSLVHPILAPRHSLNLL